MKTQELRLLVFVTRYLDLFTTFYSLYNSVFKLAYIVATAAIIIGIKYMDPIKSLYNAEQDSFPHWKYCVAPCIILTFGTCIQMFEFGIVRFDLKKLLWTFSIYLESVAILPQLMVLRKYRLVENLTGKFVFFLGMYRFFYILNWIYRANTEKYYNHHFMVYICGIVQTLLYADFFYQYSRMSRFCGLARGNCLRRRSDNDDDNSSNEDEDEDEDDDDTGLIFELSGSSKNPRTFINTVAMAGAMEPLILASEESQQMKTVIEGVAWSSEESPPDDLRKRLQDDGNTEV